MVEWVGVRSTDFEIFPTHFLPTFRIISTKFIAFMRLGMGGYDVPCSRLFSGQCSLFPAVLGPMFPVPGCFGANVPCSRLNFYAPC